MVRIDTNCPRITLDDVAGREYLKDMIRGAVYNRDSYEAIGMNKTGAYMLVGPEGSGKPISDRRWQASSARESIPISAAT